MSILCIGVQYVLYSEFMSILIAFEKKGELGQILSLRVSVCFYNTVIMNISLGLTEITSDKRTIPGIVRLPPQ